MEYENLIVQKRADHIAVVTLNRPDKLNMLSTGLMEELGHLAESFHRDTETRVVIFTGAGKSFCAGIELTEKRPAMNTLGFLRDLKRGPECIRKIYEMEQITLAAMHGSALGGGACLAAACDFRICAEGSDAGFPECRLGMNLSWVSLPLVVHLIGPTFAKEMVILGRRHDAQTLLNWGFVSEIVPAGKLLARALHMAGSYAAMPPIPAQMIKRSINHLCSALDQAIMHMDREQWLLTAKTADFAEGVTAFFEKRPAVFKGD